DFTFPNIELAPNEYVVVVQDREAFTIRYGTALNIAGQYSGRLNDAGERIRLEDAIGQTILDFDYKDGWHSITDGDGFSLTIIDPANTNPYDWNEKDFWRASAYLSGSPGEDDSGIIPNPDAVVINEVLAHSHADAADWIELHNTTNTAIDIGGWFLSDSKSDLMKYQITEGTIIAPDGYIVFYEDQHFRNIAAPGSYQPFSLSENGERLYLSSAEGSLLTGYRQVEDFGGSETGVSFGRYFKPSTGNYNFIPMSENTPGSTNAYPKVGPIVINEIMYNPSWPVDSSYTNDQYEYIELHNISNEPVTLYNFDKAQSWKFSDGIEFTFPTDVPVTIFAGGYLLVVKDPEAFAWRYPAVPVEKILGSYSGSLNNAGERLQLSMPGDVDNSGTLYYIRVDRVSYSDGSHPENSPDGVDHWPTDPDDGLVSLSRVSPQNYGNDPDNWTVSEPSPGTVNP
ncbi:MAG: lamin tail domain-containing protein, partial [Planctomycetota bacterium]